MTEPMDDEWAPPGRADEPRRVEVGPLDGPLPGPPVALSGSPAAPPGSPVGAPVLSGAVPARITLPPELRSGWASPDAPAAYPPATTYPGSNGYPGPPAWAGRSGAPTPSWTGPGGAPGPGTPGHPLANPGWSPAGANWPNANAQQRSTSGLFPSGPPRPIYREPFPVRAGAVAAGAGAGALWMLLFGLVAGTVRGYAWWTISAAIAGWLAALVLARFGDRGVAVGVAVATGLGAAIAGSVVFGQFIAGHWALW